MGCGSSKPERLLQQEEEGNESGAAAREEESARFATISALTSHLSGALGLPAAHPDVKRYASTLDSEGWDTPDAFDDLTIENLKEAPFNFKPGHLKRVALFWEQKTAQAPNVAHAELERPRSREQKTAQAPDVAPAELTRTVRGQCTVCGTDVYDTQPRLKDPATGLYQHEGCQAATASPNDPPPQSPPQRSSLVVSEAAIAKAKVDAANSAEEAQLEVAAIKAAAEQARAAVIAEAKQAAEAALEVARKEAVQIAAKGSDRESTSALSEPTQSHSAAATTAPPSTSKLVLPAGPKTKPLLADGKHAFLSYQWNVQEQVKEIKCLLNDRNVKCWMDIDGGMKSDIYDSMAEGVQGAACLICFMTQAYQDSANCKLELKFAQQSGVPIIPVMMQANFKASGWLAILTAGSIWTPMYESAKVLEGVNSLIVQARHVVPGMRAEDGTANDTASEASGEGSSFDVAAWGEDIFSLDEMREELDRLREESDPLGGRSGGADESLCPLPAMVPALPHGLFVTAEMQTVLDAVVSTSSAPQIGFCGMGGIGKTTVSCWVTRDDAVRTKFGMVAWITLGQSPVLDSCIDLLHMQLTGTSLPDGLSADQKNEHLKQAFLGRSVLLVLDDCWDISVAKQFTWIDQKTNSKVLISSRVRDVLDGGEIIDVTVPSKSDAARMLLSTAGMDVDALQGRDEVAQVVELCKRLPLTIGVAGKLIRQLADGSSMSEPSEWADILALLRDEMDDPNGSLSVEESVIRASIKAIPKKLQKQVTRLFYGFSLVPEDTHVPLPILGMIYAACGDSDIDGGGTAAPLSRMQVRRYLKILIDRSLVLGTVDRPQLHDVMLDYVQKALAGEAYKAAQRRLVEELRKSNRSSDRSTGTVLDKYMQQCVRHHIKESHDESWAKGEQAISWIEDHVTGVQGLIASVTASMLPVEALAKEAEADEMWWQAALRWNALGMMKADEVGDLVPGLPFFKLAVNASAKAADALENSSVGAGASCSLSDLDTFDLYGINAIMKSWDPGNLATYGKRYQQLLTTAAGLSRPLMCYSAHFSMTWFPSILSGNAQAYANACWKMTKVILDLCDESTESYACSTDEDRANGKPLLSVVFFQTHDLILNAPGFSWECYGTNGDKIVEYQNAYQYDVHHDLFVGLLSGDVAALGGAAFLLALQFGRVKDAREILDASLVTYEKIMQFPEHNGYVASVMHTVTFVQPVHQLLGLSKHVAAIFDLSGITFDNAEERLDVVSKESQGLLYTALEQKGPGGGLYALNRIVWQVKSMCVLSTDVPESKAIAWLDSLPDNETYIAYSMTMPTHDHGGLFGMFHACWIALAHEKVGLFEGALRFVALQMEPDVLKAGLPGQKWPQVIALACRGRVLAKLDRHEEALAAFREAITASKETFSVMEALALRELSNYAGGGGGGGIDAAAQAGHDLEAKLSTFKDLTPAEFDTFKITP